MNMEKWNRLCYHLSEKIVADISERDFELVVDRALGILGWEEYSGDFEIRPSFQLGSTKNSLKPDFLIKSNSTGQKLFVVEIKRPKVPLSAQNQIQISTYMRQFKLPFGILIGPEIQVFYDGPLNEQENAMLIGRIKFEKDSKDGEQFVSLFSKDSFSLEALHEIAAEFLKKNHQKTKIEELVKRITSDDFNDQTKELIKQHLNQEHDSEVIDAALEKVGDYFRLKESENSYREPAKNEDRERNWGNTSNDTLEIQLNPSSESEFRRLLLSKKSAYITTFYRDGTSIQKKWDAPKFTETSNVLGNLRSRQEFRKGNWQKLGIEKVYVSIEK
ncbi:MAG: hypothetical protein C0433_02265 [Cyclobacterium sp.]|nr:hypothetical protein [Cyclobacterium sp.]